jgi:hypothetical protein
VNIGKAPGVCVTQETVCSPFMAHCLGVLGRMSTEDHLRIFEGERLFALLGFTSEPKKPFTTCTALITLLLAVRILDGRRRV